MVGVVPVAVPFVCGEGDGVKLGVTDLAEPPVRSLCASRGMTVTMSTNREITTICKAIRRRPGRPFEQITAPRSPSDLVKLAKGIVESGWVSGGMRPVRLLPPIPWEESAALNRSWSFHIHSWEQVEAVLDAHSQTGDDAFLVPVLATAVDWVDRYPERVSESAFAWYDMAVGLRAQRFAYLFDGLSLGRHRFPPG